MCSESDARQRIEVKEPRLTCHRNDRSAIRLAAEVRCVGGDELAFLGRDFVEGKDRIRGADAIYGPDRIYVEMVKRAFELWEKIGASTPERLYVETGALWMHRGDDTYLRASMPIVRELGFVVDQLSIAEAGSSRRRRFNPESHPRRACTQLLAILDAS